MWAPAITSFPCPHCMVLLSYSSFQKAKAQRRVVPGSPSPPPKPAPGASPMGQEHSGSHATETTQPSWTSQCCHLQQSAGEGPQVLGPGGCCQSVLPWHAPPGAVGAQFLEPRAQRRTSGCESAAPRTKAPPFPPPPAPSPAKAAGSLQKGFPHPQPAFPTGRVSPTLGTKL